MLVCLYEIPSLDAGVSEGFLLLDFALEVVAAVAEGADGVYVEGVLAHAHCVCLHLAGRVVHLLVYPLAIVLDLCLKSLLIFLRALLLNILLLTQLLLHL